MASVGSEIASRTWVGDFIQATGEVINTVEWKGGDTSTRLCTYTLQMNFHIVSWRFAREYVTGLRLLEIYPLFASIYDDSPGTNENFECHTTLSTAAQIYHFRTQRLV